MGQYFDVYNSTKRQYASVGKFYGSDEEWKDLLRVLKWDVTDDIVAYGDEGDIFKLHDDKHENASHEEWLFCLFVAKKFSEDPHKLYDEYLKKLFSS